MKVCDVTPFDIAPRDIAQNEGQKRFFHYFYRTTIDLEINFWSIKSESKSFINGIIKTCSC